MDNALLLAGLGGIIPAILWLLFWLRIDRAHPEPRRMIAISFVLGMVAVPLVYPIEEYIYTTITAGTFTLITIILWASAEEILKYCAARFAIRSKECDEPIDAVVYLITAALGFAALENAFFLVGPFIEGNHWQGFVTGNLRFIGATLLHVLASATVGTFIAFSYYKKRGISKTLGLCTGLILAIVLHTLFNFFIIKNNGAHMFIVFGSVWASLVLLILVTERIKRFTLSHRLPRVRIRR